MIGRLNMANVLLIGNQGYNGPVVVKVLKEKGHKVTGIDTEYFSDLLYAEDEYLPDNQIRKDVRNLEPDDFQGFDVVVFLAALSNDALGELNPELTEKINYISAVNAAKYSKELGVSRFIYVSSCSVYGIHDPSEVATESSPVEPLTAYACAKVNAENALMELIDGEFGVIIMRCATMHGVAPRLRLDIVLNNLVGYALLYGEVRILSDGTPWRPMLSVIDFANIVKLFVEKGSSEVVFNIGFDDENFTVKDIGKIVSDITGVPISVNPENTPDERSYRVSFKKLMKEFPELKLEMSLKDSANFLFKAYKEYGLTRTDFDGDKYFRLRKLKSHMETGRLDDGLFWENKSDKNG